MLIEQHFELHNFIAVKSMLKSLKRRPGVVMGFSSSGEKAVLHFSVIAKDFEYMNKVYSKSIYAIFLGPFISRTQNKNNKDLYDEPIK